MRETPKIHKQTYLLTSFFGTDPGTVTVLRRNESVTTVVLSKGILFILESSYLYY